MNVNLTKCSIIWFTDLRSKYIKDNFEQYLEQVQPGLSKNYWRLISVDVWVEPNGDMIERTFYVDSDNKLWQVECTPTGHNITLRGI